VWKVAVMMNTTLRYPPFVAPASFVIIMYAHAKTAASVERTIACCFYLFRNICVVLCEPAKGLTCPQAKTTN
jgi:hypothetical protein